MTYTDHCETDPGTEARLMFAASERNADLLYATRFFAPDRFACFLHGGRSHVVMNDLEIDRARRQARVDEVISLSALQAELRREGRRAITTAAVLHRLLSGRGVRTLLVPFDFPTGLAFQLRRRGLRIQVKEGSFFDQRQIKQAREVRQITRAQRAAEAGLQAGIDLIRQARITSRGKLEQDGAALTAERVKEAINTVLLKLGFVATHTIVAGGTQGCDPHNEGHGPLPAHQPIILDVFPRSQKDGYWGDITRTVVRGRAGDKVRALYGCVAEGQALALRQCKPGASGREIHRFGSGLLRFGGLSYRREAGTHAGVLSRDRPRGRPGDPRGAPYRLQEGIDPAGRPGGHRRARPLLPRGGRRTHRGPDFDHTPRPSQPDTVSQGVGDIGRGCRRTSS